jgi:hypothetical protein
MGFCDEAENCARCGIRIVAAACSRRWQFFTGNRLYDYCSEHSRDCTSYVAGVVDALLAVGTAKNDPFICPPDKIELGQAVDVVMNYVRSHPEKRQFSAASMATVALVRAFPCNK